MSPSTTTNPSVSSQEPASDDDDEEEEEDDDDFLESQIPLFLKTHFKENYVQEFITAIINYFIQVLYELQYGLAVDVLPIYYGSNW
eukprot:CAMPEP_0117425432 /NCGR_PEP_ID=MMETSP0758-20121206/5688_1 /TAXON_ID=63605 /ORGANISM="Percolomonas cosmopolitus, Strain AE-1 (ATCC 50343)" /LENGTH=85 /DNA_ID=CAMNT_0005209879 /DNA_START=191 /DNA_END=445 /DNA_ORIENTATION=+